MNKILCLTVILFLLMRGNINAQTAAYNGGPKLAAVGQRYPIQYTEKEWKKRLTGYQYHILREKGTDPPFKNKYDEFFEKGIYYSAASLQPVFSSDAKFDSHSGWPSFYQPISPDAVLLVDNGHGNEGYEVVDSQSGSHLGDVFDDGPPPTHRRFCIDSNALIFVPEGGKPPTSSKN